MRKVITYGTFDLFHKGHYNILKRAKQQGDYLIVGVTGENYDTERGKLSVQDTLAERIEHIKNTGLADLIIVEEYDGQKISDIVKYDADVLVLGSDWLGKFDYLNKYCEVVYLERTKNISSTQIRKETNHIYNFGIVTDEILDNDYVFDAEYVSGIHIESVYSEDETISSTICKNSCTSYEFQDYDRFLTSVDIVYVNCVLEKRYEYIKKAISNGKYVISDSPISLNSDKVKELYELAKEKRVILLDNIPTVYIKSFNQLLSMGSSYIIGDIVSVKCTLSLEELSEYYPRYVQDALYYMLCTFTKISGKDYQNLSCKTVKNNEDVVYNKIELEYENSIAYGEITNHMEGKSFLELTGTKGRIEVPGMWWKASYFKMHIYGNDNVRKYCTNFEGNGFRYLMQTMMQMIKEDKLESQRLSSEDSIRIVDTINKIL